VRHILVLALLLALVGAGAAIAGRGDPQKRITPADQARARAMLIRKADMGPAFTSNPGTGGNPSFYCEALDESDLTLTGEAESPSFTSTVEFVSSRAYVYRSRSDSDASWRRGTSIAGQNCLREGLRGELQGTSVRLLSFKRIPFPKLAQRSVAFRVIAVQQGVRIYLDLVALQYARAQVAIVYGAGLTAPPAAEERKLARVTAGRMTKAMGGSS